MGFGRAVFRVGGAVWLVAVLVLAGWVGPVAVAAPGWAGRLAVDPIAHDPTVVRQGGHFYSFSTGDVGTRTYLPIRRSTDLLNWTFVGPVFATAPDWVAEELGTVPADFWAPDISFFNGLYHLYYAASSFGTNHSVIGLATTPTLDPGSPGYRWVDRGMVLRSTPADSFNAIDPDLFLDGDGTAWLSFGSFWDGIMMRRIDRATGLPSAADPTLHPIASRGGASIEGPSVVRHDGYYFLFASLDFCCRGVNSDYRIVVGRATRVTGPYLDRDGRPMSLGGGTDILRGYNEFRGTGGGDVFASAGALWLSHHYYDLADNGAPKLSVRRISWHQGWPVLGDPLSGSSRVGRGNAYVSLVHRTSGAVLDNPTCGYEGADIRISAPTGSPCQQWRPEERGGGQVSLLNRFSNKVAEVAACVNADGARVAQWGWLDNDCQKFRLTAATDGWSLIESKLAGRVLAPAGCGGGGSAIQTATPTGQACQQFRVDPIGDILIAGDAGTGVLAPARCGRQAGTPVTVRPRQPEACRLWRFTHAGEGYFHVVNVAAGRPLTAQRRAGGSTRLVLGEADRPTPAAHWRITPLNDGGYHLTNRDGWTAEINPTRNDPQRLLLLLP